MKDITVICFTTGNTT